MLATRGVGGVRTSAEARPGGDLQLDTVQAGVARHDGTYAVLESGGTGSFELVVDELGAVGHRELDALSGSDDGVAREDVV